MPLRCLVAAPSSWMSRFCPSSAAASPSPCPSPVPSRAAPWRTSAAVFQRRGCSCGAHAHLFHQPEGKRSFSGQSGQTGKTAGKSMQYGKKCRPEGISTGCRIRPYPFSPPHRGLHPCFPLSGSKEGRRDRHQHRQDASPLLRAAPPFLAGGLPRLPHISDAQGQASPFPETKKAPRLPQEGPFRVKTHLLFRRARQNAARKTPGQQAPQRPLVQRGKKRFCPRLGQRLFPRQSW